MSATRSMKRHACVLVLALLLAADFASALPPGDSWFVGFWNMTADEDGTPSDTMEFRADGSYVNYGYQCRQATAKYHVIAGDIYVTHEVPGKGPIALVFRPSRDRTKLTYTSPRTRNNAVYERLSKSPCKGS